jgi:hypothetical protein
MTLSLRTPNLPLAKPRLPILLLCEFSRELKYCFLTCVKRSQWTFLLRVLDVDPLPLQCWCPWHLNSQCYRWNGALLRWSCPAPCRHVGIRHRQYLWRIWCVTFVEFARVFRCLNSGLSNSIHLLRCLLVILCYPFDSCLWRRRSLQGF